MSMLKYTMVVALVAGCMGGSGNALDPTDVGTNEQELCYTCGDGNPNGRGVYGQEGGNTAVVLPGPMLMFQTAFVSNQKGAFLNILPFQGISGGLYPLYGIHSGVPVTVVSVTSRSGTVIVRYVYNGLIYASSGSDLYNMDVWLYYGGHRVDFQFIGKYEVPTKVNSLYEYPWRASVDQGPFTQICSDSMGNPRMASFTGGEAINAFNAQNTLDPAGTATVTVSCSGGGITTCEEWGYQPWLTAYNPTTNSYDSLINPHISCIQMKRAAYCGDTSYTLNGTPIQIDDVYDIQTTIPSALEAVWTPKGASCLNLANMRHPELGFSGICPTGPIPACPPSPSQWWDLGYQAEGKSP